MRFQYFSMSKANPEMAERHEPIEAATIEEAVTKTFFVDGYTPTQEELEEVMADMVEHPSLYVSEGEDLVFYFFKL